LDLDVKIAIIPRNNHFSFFEIYSVEFFMNHQLCIDVHLLREDGRSWLIVSVFFSWMLFFVGQFLESISLHEAVDFNGYRSLAKY
jgi:hypothetical protein